MLLLFSLLFFLLGWCIHSVVNNKKLSEYPKPPILETPEHILNYLEASANSCDEYDMSNIIGEFKTFLDQKALPVHYEPDWLHDTTEEIPPNEHWKLFLEDFSLESNSPSEYKIDIVKKWLKRDIEFTEFEYLQIIKMFNEPSERYAIRLAFEDAHFEKNNKRTSDKPKSAAISVKGR